MFLYSVTMFASLMSYGTSHFLTSRDNGSHAAQRSMMFPLQHFMNSAGKMSFPGALPGERKSRALFYSSRVGSLSRSSNSGRHLMAFRASSVARFSLEHNSE